MALSSGFIREFRASSKWDILVSIEGVGAFGTNPRLGWMFPWFGEFRSILKSVSSVSHKLQPAYGKTNVSKIDIELVDKAQWEDIIAFYYIKNRRMEVRIGPRTGNASDFYVFFTGLVVDFQTANEVLRIEARDDLYVAKEKIPEENETNTQSIVFQNMNPLDIKKALLETHAEIPSERIDIAAFIAQKETYFQGWYFDRVLTSPIAIKTLINELDEQTLNIVFPDGDKITCATFAPPIPGLSLLHLTDALQKGSLAVKGGMEDNFYNLCVVYYNWDESGSENEEKFDSIVLVSDSASQGAAEWDEVARKEIKSKWIRSRTIVQPTNITGVKIYHCNPGNGIGNGMLIYNAPSKVMSWTAPGDSTGPEVSVDRDGKYQIFSATDTKYIRVVVTVGELPGTSQSDTLAISSLPGAQLATALATHWVARYRDPQVELSFDLDIADAVHLDRFIKVSDIVKITSDRIVTKGRPKWDQERIFLTAVKPDFSKMKISVEGIHTAFKKRYGFIGPSSLICDYDSATKAQKEYAFVGNNDNKVGVKGEDGYYIW